ncbi:MAG: hypothetical protein ABL309_12735 [Phycisphaerales bacterium]
MGLGATVFLLTMVVGCYFAFVHDFPEEIEVTTTFTVLFAFMMGIFMWFAGVSLIVFGFVVYPRRRRASPCDAAFTQIHQNADQSTVRRYALDDALNPVMFTLIAGWFVWMLALCTYAYTFRRMPTDLELSLFISIVVLGALLIGRTLWLRWRSSVYAIRIDHERNLMHPARRLFSREESQPIDLRLIRSIHAERWAARVRPDGRPAPNSCARMSITASVDDPNQDRHVHLLTTTDAERVGYWLAASLGVPFVKRELCYGPHRSFRVSKPIPIDVEE